MLTRTTSLLAVATISFLGLLVLASPAQRPADLPQPAGSGTRGPSALAFSRDGKQVYVAEQETASVAVLDAATGTTVARMASGGKEPTSIAIADDGSTLLAANSFSGTLGILDLGKRSLKTTVSIPGGPCAVVSAPGRAFVAVGSMDIVAVVDLATAKITARIPVGRRPQALAMTPDRTTLVCANRAGGDLSLIDVQAGKEIARVPVGAINLRGVTLSADGSQAYVTGQQPHNDLPTERPEAMWSNVLCLVSLKGKGRLETTIPLDTVEAGAADPYGVAVQGASVFVSLGGVHTLATVNLGTESQAVVRRALVGANPRAVAIRPGGEVWVANYLGNSLSVRSESAAAERTLPLDPPERTTPRLRGQYLFASAHLTKGRRFTCNTCHPDGNTEGLAWKFVHLHDDLNPRNSRNLRGGLLLTGPYGWSGRDADFEDFVNDEIQHLLGGPKLPHGEIHALWELVNDFDLPPNPYRSPDGSFTAAAVRGRALFAGEAGCSKCHTGGQYGGAGKKEWIGTSATGAKLDVPHLVGVYDSAPYLHDASAPTLEAIFTQHNQGQLHGNAHLLKPTQMRDLIEFVREL
ncbi:MAG: ccp 3 [Chthonomonadales bacterium]|nr:ccp 3 [Chthonomonadales bacterium]